MRLEHCSQWHRIVPLRYIKILTRLSTGDLIVQLPRLLIMDSFADITDSMRARCWHRGGTETTGVVADCGSRTGKTSSGVDSQLQTCVNKIILLLYLPLLPPPRRVQQSSLNRRYVQRSSISSRSNDFSNGRRWMFPQTYRQASPLAVILPSPILVWP